MSGFWSDGFWASGFWADDFWTGLSSATTGSSSTDTSTPPSFSTAWVTVTDTNIETWVTVSVPNRPPPWSTFAPLVSATDGGVDFRLTTREQYPTFATEDRPLVSWDTQPERSE